MAREIIEFAYDETNKEFIKKYKLFFSSLFSRKMTYVYFDIETPNDVIYTTISPEVLLIGKPTTDDTIHRVKTSENLVELLNTCLPLNLMKNRYYCVNLTEMAFVKRTFPDMEKRTEAVNTFIEVGDENNICVTITKIKKIDKIPTPVECPIYYKITSSHIQYLHDIVDTVTNWVDKSPYTADIELEPRDILKSGVNHISTGDHVVISKNNIHIPLKDGFNGASCCEFIKKQVNQKLKICSGVTGSVMRCYYSLITDIVTVTSVQPTSLFIFNNVRK